MRKDQFTRLICELPRSCEKDGNEEVTNEKRKSNLSLRSAYISEANYLSELAARSKAYWPYDKDYLEKARLVTQISESDISNYVFIVLELDQKIVGFFGLAPVKGENMLDHLWVEPEFIRRGFGSILFKKAIECATELNWHRFTIVADPYAENFYLKQGATNIGSRESKVQPGFFLPLLEYTHIAKSQIKNTVSEGCL